MRTTWRSLLGLAALAGALFGLAQLAGHWQQRAVGERVAQAAPGDIVMYTTTDCPYCAQARAWFGEHGVAYTECNTTVDAACRTAFDRLKGQRQVGFQPERVAQALER